MTMHNVHPFPLRLPQSITTLHAAAVHASAQGLHLIHKGDGDLRVSPVCPPGWFKVGQSVNRPAKVAA